MNHTSPPSKPLPLVKRKKPQNDPFFSSRKPANVLQKHMVNGRPGHLVNGHNGPAPLLQRPTNASSRRSASPSKTEIPESERVSGFSDPMVVTKGVSYTDYKLVTTKKELLNGLRYHVLQMPDEKPIDIRNEAEFSKPARLHRRDPRATAPAPVKDEGEDAKDGLNQGEREELSRRKEQRQKEREANLAQVAPSAGNTRKTNNFKKKTQQVFRPDYTEEDKRRIQTNYEEKLPWHLEDFDNKYCFVGKNQIGSAHANVAFVYEPAADGTAGKYRLVPIEKVYHFDKRREDVVVKLTIEEVEKMMSRRGGDPEWLVRQREARMAEAAKEVVARKSKGLFSGAQVETIAGRQGEEADLDFDDDFADDEEGDLFMDKDEDEKLAEKKIKEDQLVANVFDMKEEKEFDNDEEKEKKEMEARKKNFKGLRKALERRERNYNHGSDSEQSYGSSSDSEEERERIEKARLENLAKAEADEKKGNVSSTSGTNTPSGRREKHGTASDREGGFPKSSSSRSLKRPGSPNLSEASGTDASTSRKKKHKSRHVSSTQPTPQPSRPISPANVPSSSAPQILSNGLLDPSAKPTIKKRKSATGEGMRAGGTGVGSDTEAAAFSDGGAMSDGSKAKRLKLHFTSNSGNRSPQHNATPQGGSRAASPTPAAGASKPISLPTPDVLRTLIPPGGITTKELLAKIPHSKERQGELLKLVKTVAMLDKDTRLLVPRKAKAAGAGSPDSMVE